MTAKPPARPWPTSELLRQIEASYFKERIGESWAEERARVEKSLAGISERLSRRFTPHPDNPVLGVGGSGIVLWLRDSKFLGLDAAVKFPRPVPGKIALVMDMLQKEIGQLSKLRHSSIVRIIYYDTAEVDASNAIPFYVMDKVEGQKSQLFVQDGSVTPDGFMRLILRTAEAIQYLHGDADRGFVHLDIKAENIVVRPPGDPVLIDLGTCKKIRGEDTLTVVACTKSIAYPKLVQRLDKDPSDEKRAKGELQRSQIDPFWDLWALGVTILHWMGINHEDGSLRSKPIYPRLPAYIRKYLLLLVARLLVDFLPEWLSKRIGLSSAFLSSFRIKDAAQLVDMLRRIAGGAGPLTEVAELTSHTLGAMQAAPGQHVPNSERLQSLLSHRLFRRLNSIAQLGLVAQVYPLAQITAAASTVWVPTLTRRSSYARSMTIRYVLSFVNCLNPPTVGTLF